VRYSIGEFSRSTSLSIKSLRLYHEKGLLEPAEVDPFTGYRYYNDANYETARIIRLLRELDFTLAEIKAILEEYQDDPELQVPLSQKLQEIRARMRRDQEISRAIELLIKQEKEIVMNTNESFTVEEKEIETILIAGLRMQGKYEQAGAAFSRLAKALGRHINGKAMALYYDKEYKEEGADFEPCFPVRKAMDGKDGISVRELKGGKCISLIHKGPYQTLGESYKKLFAYVHEKGYTTASPSREVYLKGPGMIFKGNPANYLTEIIFMLA
jgi:DNA-binding transcriptional MerR regulator